VVGAWRNGSFNWRMKFPVSLPLRREGLGKLHVQAWDFDVLVNDMVAEGAIDLQKHLGRWVKPCHTELQSQDKSVLESESLIMKKSFLFSKVEMQGIEGSSTLRPL
jgi:hypothetical protein